MYTHLALPSHTPHHFENGGFVVDTAPMTLHVIARLANTPGVRPSVIPHTCIHHSDRLNLLLGALCNGGGHSCRSQKHNRAHHVVNMVIMSHEGRQFQLQTLHELVTEIAAEAQVRAANTIISIENLMGPVTLAELRDMLHESQKQVTRIRNYERRHPAPKRRMSA